MVTVNELIRLLVKCWSTEVDLKAFRRRLENANVGWPEGKLKESDSAETFLGDFVELARKYLSSELVKIFDCLAADDRARRIKSTLMEISVTFTKNTEEREFQEVLETVPLPAKTKEPARAGGTPTGGAGGTTAGGPRFDKLNTLFQRDLTAKEVHDIEQCPRLHAIIEQASHKEGKADPPSNSRCPVRAPSVLHVAEHCRKNETRSFTVEALRMLEFVFNQVKSVTSLFSIYSLAGKEFRPGLRNRIVEACWSAKDKSDDLCTHFTRPDARDGDPANGLAWDTRLVHFIAHRLLERNAVQARQLAQADVDMFKALLEILGDDAKLERARDPNMNLSSWLRTFREAKAALDSMITCLHYVGLAHGDGTVAAVRSAFEGKPAREAAYLIDKANKDLPHMRAAEPHLWVWRKETMQHDE